MLLIRFVLVAFGDLRFNLVKAFELTYYRINDWKTTYDDFIVGKLWPLMNHPQIADTCLELMGNYYYYLLEKLYF